MSVIVWLMVLLFGFGSAFGSTTTAPEIDAGSGEASSPSATEQPEITPENGFADPFPDDLGVPDTNQEIQDRFRSRWPLPSCGLVDLSSDAGDEGWQCLQSSVGGKEGAELVVLDLAEEGPMRTTTYRVNPDGPMEIFVDTSQVPGTAPTWEYRQCQPSRDLRSEPCAS